MIFKERSRGRAQWVKYPMVGTEHSGQNSLWQGPSTVGEISYGRDRALWVKYPMARTEQCEQYSLSQGPSTVGKISYGKDRALWVEQLMVGTEHSGQNNLWQGPSTVGRIAYGRDRAMSIKTWAEHCVRTLCQISPMIKCKIRSCHLEHFSSIYSQIGTDTDFANMCPDLELQMDRQIDRQK